MDVKTGYSALVKGAKEAAKSNAELNKKIKAGEDRKGTHSSSWESVNINAIIERFAPGSTPEIVNGKVVFHSLDGRYEISADIGGGYLRIRDRTINYEVDINGNDVRYFKDQRGKKHTRSHSELMAISHFRILKREEM